MHVKDKNALLFSSQENDHQKEYHYLNVTLLNVILRCSTAPVALWETNVFVNFQLIQTHFIFS